MSIINRLLLLLLLCGMYVHASAQATGGVHTASKTGYDSMRNFVGKDVAQYVGQELCVNRLKEQLTMYGYRYFLNDYNKNNTEDGNVYKCCSRKTNFNSNYDSLAGKCFKVLGVVKGRFEDESEVFDNYNNCYLRLQEEESGDTVYFEYNSKSQFDFHFIVTGFLQKQKELLTGKNLVFASKLLHECAYLKTGNPLKDETAVRVKPGEAWQCIDVVVEDKSFVLSLLIKNSLGERVMVPHDWLFTPWSWYRGGYCTADDAELIKKTFGEIAFNMMLDGKVTVGFTKQMCRIAKGEPDKITIVSEPGTTKKTEQWTYHDGSHLEFDNGQLTDIQS